MKDETAADDSSLAATMAAESQPAAVGHLDHAPTDGTFDERYERRRLLGEGGMGEVHLCVDRRIGREIAMKVLRPGTGSTHSGNVRFLREARIQGQLEHPTTVPVYDLGLTSEGVEFFTMKRVGGVTLEEVVLRLQSGDREAAREFGLHRLLHVFQQVCLGVQYAHTRGVIHRDLKPANIMIGGFGEVYIIDWGLAKVGAEEPGAGGGPSGQWVKRGTMDGAVLGTPGYMSPEQAFDSGAVDERADVYALGAILFEILTLEPLHQGHQTFELLRSTQAGVNVPERVRSCAREVAPELEALCAEAVQVQARDRIASARRLADGVGRFLEGDRDEELRRRLAEEHVQVAEEAARRALAAGEDADAQRQKALQEAGRALALDPNSTAGTRVLMRLLVEPPREPPPAAQRAIEDEEMEEARFVLRLGGPAYVVQGLLAAAGIIMAGLRSPAGLLAIVAPIVFAGGMAMWLARQPRIPHGLALVVVVAAFAAISAVSGLGGPLLFVPGLAVGNLMATTVGFARPYRGLILLLACLAIAVPFILDWVGVLPPAYVYEDGAILLLPRVMEFPPWIEPVAMVLAVTALLVAPSLAVWGIGDRLSEMRARVHTQQWQLQQLVPAGGDLTEARAQGG